MLHRGAADRRSSSQLLDVARARARAGAGPAQLAGALTPNVATMHVTQIGDGTGGPLATVPAAIAQLVALARSFGLELPTRD